MLKIKLMGVEKQIKAAMSGTEKQVNIHTIDKESIDLKRYYNKTQVDELLDKKVDKVEGKELSTNDYTDEDKQLVHNLDIEVDNLTTNMNTINSEVNGNIEDINELKDKTNTLQNELIEREETLNHLADTKQDTLIAGDNITINDNVISSTGSGGVSNYDDLTNKPKINDVELVGNKTSEELGINIPTKLSQLTNDKDFINKTYHDSTKVDKEEGKGLSSNDFTNEEKEKLSSLENYDDTQVKQDINTIKEKIPTQATNNNQLADKDFVNSSLNSITAFYITKNANGDQFNSKAELDDATEFYSGGEVRVPTRNDYCIVLEDETKDNSTTRYIYQNEQWEFQYIVNETPLTSEQVKALNSGITPELVAKLQGIDLTNVVRDADYVHTDNNYTEEEKIKLLGLSNDFEKLDNLPKIKTLNSVDNEVIIDIKGIKKLQELGIAPFRLLDMSDYTSNNPLLPYNQIINGTYMTINDGYIKTSTENLKLTDGSLIVKFDTDLTIITDTGNYWYTYSTDGYEGGYAITNSEVEGMLSGFINRKSIISNNATSIVLNNNFWYQKNSSTGLTKLTQIIPATLDTYYEVKVSLNTSSTSFTNKIQNSSKYKLKFVGLDCVNGEWNPRTNMRYNLDYYFDGAYIVCNVTGFERS